MKTLQSTVSQLRKEKNYLLDFRQLVDKDVSRVSKALKLIMEKRNLDFAGLWNINNISSIQVLISVGCGYYHTANQEGLHTVYLALSCSCPQCTEVPLFVAGLSWRTCQNCPKQI